MDVVSDSLQGGEVGDVVQSVAGLLQQSLVDDDAEGLIQAGQVADLIQGGSLALSHLSGQSVGVGAGSSGDDLHGHAGLLGVDSGQSLPGLVSLGLKVQIIDLAGSGGDGLRGLGGLGLGGLLGLSGSLRLGSCLGLGGGVAAASHERQSHGQSQDQCKQLFHLDSSY